jgi:hypothetical protein
VAVAAEQRHEREELHAAEGEQCEGGQRGEAGGDVQLIPRDGAELVHERADDEGDDDQRQRELRDRHESLSRGAWRGDRARGFVFGGGGGDRDGRRFDHATLSS